MLDSVEFRIMNPSWPTDDSSRNVLYAGPIEVLKKIQKGDRRTKRFALRESTVGLTQRAYDLVLPLHGIPVWTESKIELQP